MRRDTRSPASPTTASKGFLSTFRDDPILIC